MKRDLPHQPRHMVIFSSKGVEKIEKKKKQALCYFSKYDVWESHTKINFIAFAEKTATLPFFFFFSDFCSWCSFKSESLLIIFIYQ